MKKYLFLIIPFVLSSCTNSEVIKSPIIIKDKNTIDKLNSYNFTNYGTRGISGKEVYNLIKGDNAFVYEFGTTNNEFYTAYVKEKTDEVDVFVDHSFPKSLQKYNFTNIINGSTVYNLIKSNNQDKIVWAKYESEEEIKPTLRYDENTYYLDMVYLSKNIKYTYDVTNGKEINVNTNCLIRNLYNLNEDDSLTRLIINTSNIGTTQYIAECYYTNLTGKFIGKTNCNIDDITNIVVLNDLINDFYNFKIITIENEEYLEYLDFFVDAKYLLDEYYEALKDSVAVNSETNKTCIKISDLLEFISNNL